ncbi:hypothetical protein M3Y99_00646600 [Aphelenchoides fujianensis]|nr:hypothetical protein M3Y99_00646600 [Aphelenchoides fujianensis]
MAPPFVVPPNAKYEPQNVETVGFETQSKDLEVKKACLFVGWRKKKKLTREDVIQLCSMYGELSGVSHAPERFCAFVLFARQEDAEEALRNLDGWFFRGGPIAVKRATPPKALHFLAKHREKAMKRSLNAPQHGWGAKASRFEGPPAAGPRGFVPGALNPRTNAPFPLRGGGRKGRSGNRLGGSTPADGGGFGQYGAEEGGFRAYSAGPSSSNSHYEHDRSTGEYGEASGNSFDGYEQAGAFDYAADWSEYPQEPAHEYSQEFGEETSGQFDQPPPADWDSREFEAGGSQTPRSAASGYSRGKSGPSFGPPPRRPPVQPPVQPRCGRVDGRKAVQPADETPNEHERHAIPDVFICGGCHWTTANPRFFVQHRMKPCGISQVKKGEGEPPVLKCQMCAVLCKNAWDLVAHLGKKHSIYLFNETLFSYTT